jgi:two-component system, OmpR family, sensor histidine kinase ChvG
VRLRAQLLLVSLTTLALPWAGCQYVREMEHAQRRGVEDTLLASAGIVASALAARPELLYPYLEQRTAPRDRDSDVYAVRIDEPAEVDGYADGWVDRAGLRLAPSTVPLSLRVEYATAVDRHYLTLFLRVRDAAIVYLDPVLGELAPHDHVLVVAQTQDGYTQGYLFATAAPGPLVPTDATSGEPASRLRGYWQAVPHGYQLELRMPLGLVGARFGFSVVDADDAGYVGTAGTLRDDDAPTLGIPGLFVYPPNQLRTSLVAYRQSGKRLRVLDKAGFALAEVGALAGATPAPSAQENEMQTVFAAPTEPRVNDSVHRGRGFLERLYGLLLEHDPVAPSLPASAPGPGTADAPGVEAALAGHATARWYRSRDEHEAIVAASQPIRAGDELLGAVVLEQTSEAILTLTNGALARLVNATLLASVLAAAALLGYATWLSLRIRRLSDASARALDARGRIAAAMPGAGAGDEIGDLARGFATLLERLREHTGYLQTLASTLSHELRTPLAVVQSSLENLGHQALDGPASIYAARAQEGAERLRAILAAMSEATRVEQSIEGAPLEPFDLAALVRGAVAAYRDVYAGRRIDLHAPDEACPLRGAPELIVQMLDKLVDNAVDFTPPEGRIAVSLYATPGGYRLAVDNDGPPLPTRMQGNLFDSLVSVRNQRSERAHLGFGLHIARLIAAAHGGTIEARDRAGGGGVEFAVTLPRDWPARSGDGQVVRA